MIEQRTTPEDGSVAPFGESLRAVLDAVAVGVTVQDRDGRIVYANAAAAELIGTPDPGELTAAAPGEVVARFELLGEDGAPLAMAALPARAALEGGHPAPLTVGFRNLTTGEERWSVLRASPLPGPEGEPAYAINAFQDITERVIAEREAREAARRARRVAAASERLDESLDPAGTVRAAGAIAVPDLADVCVIDLLAADGSTTRAAIVVGDPRRQAVADALMDYPSIPGSGGLMGSVFSSGRSVLVEDVTDELLLARTKDVRHAGILSDLGIRSAIAVPLAARGQMLGAIALIHGWSGRRYAPDDVQLAEELARRVGLALANARLYVAEQDARRAAEHDRDRTQRLQRLAGKLAEASSVGAVAALVLAEARTALDATAGSIYELDAEAQALALVIAEGYDEAVIDDFRRIPLTSDAPLAFAARTGEALWLPDLAAARASSEELAQVLRRSTHGAAAAIPLRAEGRVLGAMGLSFPDVRTFPAADREHVLALGELAAQGVARAVLGAARAELMLALDAQRARLEAVVEQAPVGVVIADAATGRLLLGNAEVDRIYGRPFEPADDEDAGPPAFLPDDGRALTRDETPLARAIRGETVEAEELAIIRADGSRATLLAWAAPIRAADGTIGSAVVALTDITERRMAQENQRFLAEAGELLGSSLDYEETLRRVAGLAVPRIADWVSIELVDDAGELSQLVVAHVDPAKVELARRLRERYPPDRDSPQGSYAVARTGRSELVTDIPADAIRATIPDGDERLAILHELQLHSYMAVPLRSGGRTLGVITFVGAESGRRYVQADLDFAESVAARAAGAIENARLYRDADRFRRLLDATLDVVFVVDPESMAIVHANLGAAIATGIEASGLVGAPLESVLPDLDAEHLRGLTGPASAAADARTMTLALDGPRGPVPVEVLVQRIELAGGPDRLVAVARDITDRVEAQARLQRLAEAEHARAAELDAVIHAMGEAVFVCAADGSIVLANPAAEGMFPEVEERSYAEVLANLDDPIRIAPRLRQNGGPVELRAHGDEERWIELSTYAVGGRPATEAGPETIVVLRDVTAARQRQAVRDTFVGILSHELRTPVTTIYGGSKILGRANNLSEEQRRDVFEDIATEAERLHRLVEDVIALNRFGEEGGEEIGHDPVLLQRVLGPVIKTEENRWPGVTFEAAIPSGLPTVVADRTYVEQVVRNLLSNAAKYGGPGTTVRTEVETSGDEVCVRILDDGPGFPPGEAERLFDLFFRSSSTSAKASGAGIGLFVTARLIRAMGGRVWALPREGPGAEFGFALRVMADD